MPEALPIVDIVEPRAGGPANFLTLWSPMPEALPIFEIVEPRAGGRTTRGVDCSKRSLYHGILQIDARGGALRKLERNAGRNRRVRMELYVLRRARVF